MTYKVVHVGGAQEEDGVVVRELGFVDIGTVMLDVAAVVNVVFRVNEANVRHPVPRLVGPVCVRRVLGVARETGTNVEEAAVGDTCKAVSLSQMLQMRCSI